MLCVSYVKWHAAHLTCVCPITIINESQRCSVVTNEWCNVLTILSHIGFITLTYTCEFMNFDIFIFQGCPHQFTSLNSCSRMSTACGMVHTLHYMFIAPCLCCSSCIFHASVTLSLLLLLLTYSIKSWICILLALLLLFCEVEEISCCHSSVSVCTAGYVHVVANIKSNCLT